MALKVYVNTNGYLVNTDNVSDAVIVKDSGGNLWSLYNIGASIYCRRSIDGGLTWGAAETVVTEFPYFDITGIHAAIDSSDVIHLVYANRPDVFGFRQLFYFYRNPITGWSAKENVLGDISNLNYPRIAVDSSNDVHCVYNERRGGSARVSYVKRTGGVWGAPTIIATKVSRLAAYREQDVCVDSNDFVHVVYRGSFTQPWLHYKLWNGAWQAEETLAGVGGNEQSHPAIAVDSGDVVHVAWAGEGYGATYPARYQVCHIAGNTGAWGAVECLTDINSNQGYPYGLAVAVNGLDEVDICWNGSGHGGTGATGNHIKYSGGAWSGITVLSDYNIASVFGMLWAATPAQCTLPTGFIVLITGKFTLPAVTTDPVTDRGIVALTANGTLTDDGGEVCDCGFEWGKAVPYTNTTPVESKTTGETFSQILAPLEPATTYHLRAFATNTVGTSYGADVEIRTYPAPSRGHSLSREEL